MSVCLFYVKGNSKRNGDTKVLGLFDSLLFVERLSEFINVKSKLGRPQSFLNILCSTNR